MNKEYLESIVKEFNDRLNQCIRPDGTFDSTGKKVLGHFLSSKAEEIYLKGRESVEIEAWENINPGQKFEFKNGKLSQKKGTE